MSEVNLTLTAKPFTVSTRVKWAQNATILHYVEAKCEMHRGSLITVFVRRSEKLDRSVSVQLDTNEPGRYMRRSNVTFRNIARCTLSLSLSSCLSIRVRILRINRNVFVLYCIEVYIQVGNFENFWI